MNPIYKMAELTPEEISRRIPKSHYKSHYDARRIILALAVIQGKTIKSAGELIGESAYRARLILRAFTYTALKDELEPGEPGEVLGRYDSVHAIRKYKEYWLERAVKVAEYWGCLSLIEEASSNHPVSSTSDERTVNNVMRHAYRVLTDEEKALMQAIKDKGLELNDLIESIGNSRELSIAKTKTEEAVMWAVKHLTR